MKLLLVLASTGPMVGGMERQVALQANHLSKLDSTQVSVIASPCFSSLFSPCVNFVALDMSRSRRNLKLLFDLRINIRQISPDLVHAHGHKSAYLLSTIKFLLNTSIKLIATSHNVKRNNRALDKMDYVFSVSEGVQDVVKPKKSLVVHNGIEACSTAKTTRSLFCESVGIDPKRPLILGVGRLVKTKNFESLILACNDLDANLVLLGDGPELRQLTTIASDNVRLAGYREDTRSILFVADMMVICAKRDGFSLALIEALHSRLPVLSTRVPGAQDLLPESCLIDSTKTEHLKPFIQHHLDNMTALRNGQEEQFRYAENDLQIERVAEKTHGLYTKIISGLAL